MNDQDPSRDDSRPITCADCGGSQVRSTLVTSVAVYLRCEDCGAIWSIAERRRFPRRDGDLPPTILDPTKPPASGEA